MRVIAGRYGGRRLRAPAGAATRPTTDRVREALFSILGARVEGAAVLSMRGGDFLFDSGEDFSIGYESHGSDAVELYLEESFSFMVATPEAAVPLPA